MGDVYIQYILYVKRLPAEIRIGCDEVTRDIREVHDFAVAVGSADGPAKSARYRTRTGRTRAIWHERTRAATIHELSGGHHVR
jgi:hypothetical protein